MKESIKKRIEAVRHGEVPEKYSTERAMLFPDEWGTPVALNTVLSENKDRNEDLRFGKEDVLSVSGEQGIVNQIDLLGRSYAGESVAPYHVVETGDVVYTKSPLKENPYGIIKQNHGAPGIVSTLYAVYHCSTPITGQYLENYFCIDTYLNNYLKPLVKRGAKNDMKVNNEEVLLGRIPLPSLQEQERINEIIAQFDRMIDLKRQLVDENKKTKRIFLRRLFPMQGKNVPELRFPGFEGEWRKSLLGELSDFITKGATPTTYGYQWEASGIPFFRNDSIQENRFVYGEYSFISETAHTALSRSEVKADDILIAITGDIGKVGIVPKEVLRGNINQHMARVRIIKDALPFFVYQYLSTDTMQNTYQVIKTGISMPQLSLEQIRNTEILLPSLEEQQRIASCLMNLDEAIELHLQELEEVQRKKIALMQLLLTGLVRVNA